MPQNAIFSSLFLLPAPGPPVAAAVRSHFNDCPDSHSQFCFHGTCRFLVQEDKPACVCHSGYVGTRCEHADLLAVVAANQKKQTITVLVVVSVVASALLIGVCVLIHCCRLRKHCQWCRAPGGGQEKPGGLLKGGASCCHTEMVLSHNQAEAFMVHFGFVLF
uniref:Transforming growth factor alpha n=1 Tax=Amazona collaria TaxID=241587 RepID=A0A8B9G4H3_9PSIT